MIRALGWPKLIHSPPELTIRLTGSCRHELVENRPQPAHPPIESERLKDFDALTHPLPVIHTAGQCDLRDSANALHHLVTEVGRVGVHNRDLARSAHLSRSRREIANQRIVNRRIRCLPDLARKTGHGLREFLHIPLMNLLHKLQLPLVSHQPSAQSLRELIDVVAEPLHDRQPNRIRRKRQRQVAAERDMNCLHQRVRTCRRSRNDLSALNRAHHDLARQFLLHRGEAG